MKKGTRILALLLAVILTAALAGCAEKKPAASNAANTANSAENTANTSNNTNNTNNAENDPANTAQNQPAEDGPIKVSSVEELLNAIKPGAEIVMEARRYDIGQALETIWKEKDNWEKAHPYIKLESFEDGKGFTVTGVKGLKISGGGKKASDTELITAARYVTVLTFENCSDLELSNFTAGHTDGAECFGDVIDLVDVRNVNMSKLDLYGCGVHALTAAGDLGNYIIKNCTLRDCSENSLEIGRSSGTLLFENCTMTGSGRGAYIQWSDMDVSNKPHVYLMECKLGTCESEFFAFDDNTITEGCDWSPIEYYPDVDPGETSAAFEPSGLIPASFSPEGLAGSAWEVYVMVPADADITKAEYEPYEDPRDGRVLTYSLRFDAEGNFTLLYFAEQPIQFTKAEDGYKDANGKEAKVEIFVTPNLGASLMWMRLEYEGWAMWFQN